MMQKKKKKKLFTLVHCAVGNQHAQHTYAQTGSCTPESHALFSLTRHLG